MSSVHVDGLVQDCAISNADALAIPQFCTKPSNVLRFFAMPNTQAVLARWDQNRKANILLMLSNASSYKSENLSILITILLSICQGNHFNVQQLLT